MPYPSARRRARGGPRRRGSSGAIPTSIAAPLPTGPGLGSTTTLTEAQWERMVEEAARWHGYLAYHTRDSRGSVAGYPDLTLARARDGRILFLELKAERGRVRPEQRAWLAALGTCPSVVARVLRPSQWDELVRLLEGRDDAGEAA